LKRPLVAVLYSRPWVLICCPCIYVHTEMVLNYVHVAKPTIVNYRR
jgi:hypothetical protein